MIEGERGKRNMRVGEHIYERDRLSKRFFLNSLQRSDCCTRAGEAQQARVSRVGVIVSIDTHITTNTSAVTTTTLYEGPRIHNWVRESTYSYDASSIAITTGVS